ncbi:hypothetical protein BLA6993_03176 [Burkholderia lata]|uniref:hypothetical protein n=1 Tax=Burkholderia lata (strain ATCC 17760 / DSM 23089 / LMG 22485 / NCIMB 9086 / R18194 / 383) TaxID=482957 RepID=UPI001452FBA9|nr:hypothetical protein [Burkholderia lata]VWB67765.1 hypothetical protein BLA6993_03176 [Burkholderia lata]
MTATPPERIAINHDEFDAKYVGRTANGSQFFLTTPFVPESSNRPGAEYVALYLFDAGGALQEARIEAFGPRAAMDQTARNACFERYLAELGEVQYGRIEIAPFSVKRFGVTFGLLADDRDEDDDAALYIMEPGNYMAFFEPWDSGDYDT